MPYCRDPRAAVGEDAEALDAFERAAEIRERAVGPDHASRMDTYYLLGVTLEKLGDLDEAGRVYREIAAWSERSGSEGWGFAMRVRLAHVVELQGDLERPCREYRAAASGDSSGHEPRQMQQLFTEALQGAARCAWRERRELAETVALLERALAIRERVFGTRSAEAAEVHDGLGLAYGEGGDLDASRQALSPCLDRFTKALAETAGNHFRPQD